MPAQLTGTKGCCARGLAALIARATSLPAPLSPVIRTLESERATRSISAFSSIRARQVPISSTGPVWWVIAIKGSDTQRGDSSPLRGVPLQRSDRLWCQLINRLLGLMVQRLRGKRNEQDYLA